MLGSDIEYPLRSNTLSAKSVLGGRVALTLGPSHILLQVSPYYEDIDGEYRGGGVEEERENKGGGVSIE